jgi:hypothetical protein
MIPRVVLIIFSLLLCSCGCREALLQDGIKIRYVLIRCKRRLDFLRFSDIFKKSRPRPRICVLPLDCEQGGVYFVIGLNRDLRELPQASSIKIQCLFSSKARPEMVYESEINREFDEHSNEIYFKISDNYSARKELIAWKVTIYSSDGEPVVVKKSYLFSEKNS